MNLGLRVECPFVCRRSVPDRFFLISRWYITRNWLLIFFLFVYKVIYISQYEEGVLQRGYPSPWQPLHALMTTLFPGYPFIFSSRQPLFPIPSINVPTLQTPDSRPNPVLGDPVPGTPSHYRGLCHIFLFTRIPQINWKNLSLCVYDFITRYNLHSWSKYSSNLTQFNSVWTSIEACYF